LRNLVATKLAHLAGQILINTAHYPKCHHQPLPSRNFNGPTGCEPPWTGFTQIMHRLQTRSFVENDLVYARNFAGHPLWVPSQIVAVTGPKSYRPNGTRPEDPQSTDARPCTPNNEADLLWETSTPSLELLEAKVPSLLPSEKQSPTEDPPPLMAQAELRRAGNGLAQQAVQSAKEALARLGPGDWLAKVATYVLMQHATTCPETNHSPAEILMGKWLRTNLDRLHPGYAPKKPLDSTARVWVFNKGDLV
ncbi:hypothetical protein E2320_003761, partial [Naja naja]